MLDGQHQHMPAVDLALVQRDIALLACQGRELGSARMIIMCKCSLVLRT